MKVYFDSLRTWWLPLRLHWYLLLMVAASLNLNEISRILHRSTTQTPRFIATSLQPPLIPVKPYLSCHVMLGKLQSPKSPKCSVYAGRHLPHCSEINYGSGPSKGGDTFTAMAVGSDRAHGGKDVHKATIASTSPTILGHSTTGPHGQDTTSEVSEGPVHTQPKPKFEWRPRSGPSAAPGVQVSSGKETNPSRRLENALIPHPSQSEPRVAIVAPLPRLETAPPSVCVDRGLKPEDPTPHGWCESGSEMEGDDDEDVSEVWEESMHSNEENEVVCWESEEEPLEVVPLAMETLKEFGLVLGASFEEFEEELTQLLQNIEDWLYCGSDGASGGVVVMWDTRVVEKIDETVGHFSISCKFHSVFNHHEWVFSGVYVPQTVRDRLLMWEELACLHSWWGSPWCIKGDFNVVRFPSERVGGQFFSPAMQGFSDFISSIGLVDPLLEGGRFTWSNGKEREAMSRLDRFLFSPDWEDKFPCIVQRKMPRLMSDHFPITLECCQFQKCRRHFRFENMWLRAEVAEGRPLTATEKAQKEIIQIDLEKTLLLEEISWRQKSQATWLNEGDKNTKKIHAMANSNRRHNSISTLLIDGELSTNQQAISESITQFYTRLYTKDVGWRPKLDGLGFSAYLLKMLNG
uniref:Endonuclease/exonuclease/phosphatase domain-containing protein n=1 Tax=Fagus sylvatica TaxID=28930 RepID=A0A2N9GFH2_FAGSY